MYVCVQMVVPGGQRRAVLQSLLPDTQYKVTVTPMYTNGEEGISASALGSTREHYKPPTHTHTHLNELLPTGVKSRLLIMQRCSSQFGRTHLTKLKANENDFYCSKQKFHLHCINFMFIYVLQKKQIKAIINTDVVIIALMKALHNYSGSFH